MKKIAVISDNIVLISRFRQLIIELNRKEDYIFYSTSQVNAENVNLIDVKKEWELLCSYYLIISLHCKQLFPKSLISKVKCINIHPGLNPYNRGWFPQVFSIINKLPAGATIHEIDEELDHGNIIGQKEINIESYDTSFTAYNKILDIEIDLLRQNLDSIISDNYKAFTPKSAGNLNLKSDFNELCRIDLDEKASYRDVIDHLRALSHDDYNNAFYEENGRKVYLRIIIERKLKD